MTEHAASASGRERRSRWYVFLAAWRRFRRSRPAIAGLGILAMFAVAAVVHPILLRTVWPPSVYHPEIGYDALTVTKAVVEQVEDPETEIEVMRARLLDPFVTEGDTVEVREPSRFSAAHPLGLDPLGRDVLSMTMAGASPTLLMGVTAAIATAVVGTSIACLGAYYRGWIDNLFGNLSNMLLLLPVPILMIILGTSDVADYISPPMFGLIYGVITGAGSAAVVLRSEALPILQQPYIDAARVSGAGPRRLITHHLLPNLLPTASVHLLIGATGAVVTYGFVSFLAYTSTRFNWGTMVYFAVLYPSSDGNIPWNVLLAGGAAISLFAASFYLIALGVRSIIDDSARADQRTPAADYWGD